MTNPNGSLPDFLLIYSPTTGWYITDRFGNLLFNNANISLGSKLRILHESGATYQVVDPRKYQEQDTDAIGYCNSRKDRL